MASPSAKNSINGCAPKMHQGADSHVGQSPQSMSSRTCSDIAKCAAEDWSGTERPFCLFAVANLVTARTRL